MMITHHHQGRRTSLSLRIKARLKVNTQAKERIASKEEVELVKEEVESLSASPTSRSSSRSKC